MLVNLEGKRWGAILQVLEPIRLTTKRYLVSSAKVKTHFRSCLKKLADIKNFTLISKRFPESEDGAAL